MPDRTLGTGLAISGGLPAPSAANPPGYVTISSPVDGEFVRFLLDQAAPQPSGDYGGWETVTIPRKRPIRYWASNPEAKLQLGVVVEKDEQSATEQLRTLREMGTGTEKRRPRQVEIDGPLPPLPVKRWVIDDVQFGEALYTPRGALIRQFLTITFGEPPTLDAATVKRGGRSARRDKDGKKSKKVRYARIRKGETLQQFSARTLGNPNRWKDVAALQKPKIKDPRKVKDGRKLRLP